MAVAEGVDQVQVGAGEESAFDCGVQDAGPAEGLVSCDYEGAKGSCHSSESVLRAWAGFIRVLHRGEGAERGNVPAGGDVLVVDRGDVLRRSDVKWQEKMLANLR